MKMPNSVFNRKIIQTILMLAALPAAWFYRVPLMQILSLFGNPQAIADYLRGLGLVGPVMLSVLLLVQLFVAFIPGQALVMAAGYIYGAKTTIIVVAVTGILGSQLVFWLSRKFGRPSIFRFAPQSLIEKWDHIAGDRGPLFYFFMFVFPFVPSDMMCYVAGLGKISGKRFFVANFAGRLLSTIAITLIGVYGFHPPIEFWVLFIGCLGLLWVAWAIYDGVFRRIPSQHELARRLGLILSNAYRNVLGIRYSVCGLEHLPRGPKILAANHPGASDTLLLPPIFEEQVTGLAEEGQFKNPIVGWILTHSGHIPVRAKNPEEAFDLSSQALLGGKTILIFPEGTLNPEYKEIRAKSGAVRLSLKTGAPIIPVGIYVPRKDTLNLRWYSKNGRGHGGRFQFRGQYSVQIGRPWRPGETKANDQNPLQVHELTRRLMNQIYCLIEQAKHED